MSARRDGRLLYQAGPGVRTMVVWWGTDGKLNRVVEAGLRCVRQVGRE